MVPKPPPKIEIRSVGHCIYCDNDGSAETLTEEHVIPYSFGGYRVLGFASCSKCRDVTHAIEGQCDRTMFKALRVHHGIQTRRPKKRPTHLPILVGTTPHGAPKEEIPVATAPGFAPFPIFAAPQILSGSPPSDRVDFGGCVVCATTDDATERQRRLVAEGRPGALAYSEIPLGPFLRTLAKIGHAYVVSQVGLGAFHHLLPPIILGESAHASYYVGGTGELPTVVPPSQQISGDLHQIYPLTLTIRGTDYIAVQIRLFGHLQPLTPVYLIIVGEYSGPKGSPHPVIV